MRGPTSTPSGRMPPGRRSSNPLILKRAKVFVDDRPQAIHSGEINVPITKGLFHAHDIAGTLGEVVVGVKGRKKPDEITVFDSTGLAIQDLAIAGLAMARGKWVESALPLKDQSSFRSGLECFRQISSLYTGPLL